MIVYKIRRVSDGLFSAGGSWPNFTKKGKAWSSLGSLKNHLRLILESIEQYPWRSDLAASYSGCEIVPYQITEQQLSSLPADNPIFEQYEGAFK